MTKSNRGGARKGAGRPKSKMQWTTICVRLTPDDLKTLDSFAKMIDGNRSDAVRRLIADAAQSICSETDGQ